MCRFLAYKGKEVLLSNYITKPSHSLIMQSFKAKERKEPLNGDGFGVGWYVQSINDVPCIFNSVTPAWSNRNLFRLAEKVKSDCFFAHVRAATEGLLVNELNCHPFNYDKYMWMHNGKVAEFKKIKRKLRSSLSEDVYHWIKGTTDSEHSFAVFLDMLGNKELNYTPLDLASAMIKTIHQLQIWLEEEDVSKTSFLNFALTDGKNIIVSHYVSPKEKRAASLYYSKTNSSILVASEPLDEDRNNWIPVGENKILIVQEDLQINEVNIPI